MTQAIVVSLAVPVAWFAGWWMAKQALTNQARRDAKSVLRHASVAEKTRVLAKQNGGNWPRNGEHIW